MTVFSLTYMSPKAQVRPSKHSRAIAPITHDLKHTHTPYIIVFSSAVPSTFIPAVVCHFFFIIFFSFSLKATRFLISNAQHAAPVYKEKQTRCVRLRVFPICIFIKFLDEGKSVSTAQSFFLSFLSQKCQVKQFIMQYRNQMTSSKMCEKSNLAEWN